MADTDKEIVVEMTKRVLLIPDVVEPEWAWARRAYGIQKYAPERFDVQVIAERKYKSGMAKDYDAVLSMGWMSGPAEGDNTWTMVSNSGILYEHDKESSFYPQRCASRAKNRKKAKQRIPEFRGVITIDFRTIDFLNELNDNVAYLNTGVDTDVFVPGLINEPYDQGCYGVREGSQWPLRVGWIGKAYDDPGMWTSKGWHEVMVPLMSEGIEGVEWVCHRDDIYGEGYMNTEKMVDWYNRIDVLMITSCSDSTPSTLLEACACGIPFIATNIGVAGEINRWCGTGELAGTIVGKWERLSECRDVIRGLQYTTKLFRDDRDMVRKMGIKARHVMEARYSWENLSEQWLEVLCGN